MTEIRWEDPPPPPAPRRGRRPGIGQEVSWMTVGDTLRTRPGQWAWVATRPELRGAQDDASSIRCGRYLAMGRGPWEAISRTVAGEHRVYARYVGGGQR